MHTYTGANMHTHMQTRAHAHMCAYIHMHTPEMLMLYSTPTPNIGPQGTGLARGEKKNKTQGP